MSRPNTYAKINLRNLIHNYHVINDISQGKTILCIVKADAYGHGAPQCAKALEESGAEYFAVASFNEAKELRDAGINKPILVLGHIPMEDIEQSLPYQLTYTVFSLSFAKALNECAKNAGVKVKVHIKVNTGMNRLGFSGLQNCIDKILLISKMDNILIEGIFSHFAAADEEDLSYTRYQYELFKEILQGIKKEGIDIPMIHISNSAAIAAFDTDVTTAVRPGIILYGIHPSSVIQKNKLLPIKPVMTLFTSIANISYIEDNTPVSYGRRYYSSGKRKIAVLCAGYADGYFRSLSNKGEVLISGQRAKIIGNICMDMFMVDVTHIDDIYVGDEVVLFGENLPVTELSNKIGTIPYEITCSVSKRVKRIY